MLAEFSIKACSQPDTSLSAGIEHLALFCSDRDYDRADVADLAAKIYDHPPSFSELNVLDVLAKRVPADAAMTSAKRHAENTWPSCKLTMGCDLLALGSIARLQRGDANDPANQSWCRPGPG
jgi:hypothetical protein